MDMMLVRHFQFQILLQCDFVLRAAGEIDVTLKTGDSRGTFYAVQNLLNSAANISKALWGSGGKYSAERQDVRDSIGVDDNSPLREVAMRNHFEHFDERLTNWWKSSAKHNHLDLNFASRSAISFADPIDKFRNFDPSSGDLTFWGDEFNLKTIIDEVMRIYPKLQQEANKFPWS